MGRTRDARKEDAIPGQSGWPAGPASRAGGATGCFGRESMLGIYIDGPSRAVRYSSRAPRPGCPCPAASISSIKISLVNELNLILSSHRVGVFFQVVFLASTVGPCMAWLAGVQALRSATEQRSGPSQAAWAGGSAGWWGGGPQTRWKAAGSGAMRSCRRSVAGDRRGRLELARCWQA